MTYNPTNILVTGGCGFIASNFINSMVIKYPDYNFVNIDCLYDCSSTKNIISPDLPNYTFVKANIRSTEFIKHILEIHNVDTILHFAAQSHVDNSFGNPLQCTYDNVLGTQSLLEACREHNKIKRFIHVSTDEVYGESELNESHKNEQSLLSPTNPYSATKAAAEMIVMSYIKSYNFPIIITRGNNVYGINQYPEKLIPRFTCLLKENKKVTIQGDGLHLRSFIHVDDVSNAFDVILHNGVIGEIYNIGSDDHCEFTVNKVAQMIISTVKPKDDFKKWISFIADRNFNDKRYFISNDKLKNLGWKQKISFEDGLKNVIKWYLNKNVYDHWNVLKL